MANESDSRVTWYNAGIAATAVVAAVVFGNAIEWALQRLRSK
jgi:HAMP domain-containing protein